MVTAVAPVTVMFEKLLLFQFEVIVVELPEVVMPVTVPPAPVLLKAVTIELLFIVWLPPAGTVTLLLMNVTLPVVLVVMFVNVLLLTLVFKQAIVLFIIVMAPVPATV